MAQKYFFGSFQQFLEINGFFWKKVRIFTL